jgi:membrane fusion protein (multidrug efflux system)
MAAQVSPLVEARPKSSGKSSGSESNDNAVAAAPAAARKGGRARIVMAGLLAAAALGGGLWYAQGVGKQATDDAQVEGHVMNVSARVSGQVAQVYARDNQTVHEGDLLVELDHSELDAKADAARADLAAARAQLDSAQSQLDLTSKNADANLTQARGGVAQASGALSSSGAAIRQAEADVTAARARLKLATTELDREKRLAQDGAVSAATLDGRQNEFDQAQASYTQAEARLESTRANAAGASGGLVFANGRLAAAQTVAEQLTAARAAVQLAEAKVKQAESQLALAELAASYAYVRAPHDGEVSRRTVEVGQMVGPDKPLLAVVPLDDVWVVANFKEDQLAEMKAGQAATVTVDAFGSHKLTGHVDSVAGASGARFALLPPDNASGNFVKVVQRVPVLVRLDDAAGVELRPGMSADVTVRTH